MRRAAYGCYMRCLQKCVGMRWQYKVHIGGVDSVYGVHVWGGMEGCVYGLA